MVTPQLAADLRAVGADGVIVPDLPPEEAGELRRRAARRTAWLRARSWRRPAPPRASRAVAALDPVFIYCVALVGVTGARQDLSATLGDFLGGSRAERRRRWWSGFGISQPEHVRRVARARRRRA